MVDIIQYGARMELDKEVAGYGLLKGTSGVTKEESRTVCRLCESLIASTEDLLPQWRLTRIGERTVIFLIQKEKLGRIRYNFFVYLLDEDTFAHLLRVCGWDWKTLLNNLQKNRQRLLSIDDWDVEPLAESIFNEMAETQAAYKWETPKDEPPAEALRESLLFGALASDKGGCKVFLVMPTQEQWPAMHWLLATLPVGLASRLRAGSATEFRQSNGAALVFIEPQAYDTCSREGSENNVSTSVYRDGELRITANSAEQLMRVVKSMLSFPEKRWEAARNAEPYVTDWQRFYELLMKEPEPPVEEPLYEQPAEPAYVPAPEPFYPQPAEPTDAKTTESDVDAVRPEAQSNLRPKKGTFLKPRDKKSRKNEPLTTDEKAPKETALQKSKQPRPQDAPEGEPADREEGTDDNTRPFMSRFLAALAAIAAFALFLLLVFGSMRCASNGLSVTLTWNGSNPFDAIFGFILGGLAVFFCNKVKKTK